MKKLMLPILALVFGLILGLAGGIVPRFFNIDPMAYLTKPAEESVEKAHKKEEKAVQTAIHPKEVELRRLIADVSKQRTTLEEREKALNARYSQFDQATKDLEALKKQIDDAEARARKSMIEIAANEQVNMKKLSKTWGQMDPAEVASLVKGLDIDTAAKIMSLMQERQTAPILGALATVPATEKLAADLVLKLKQIKRTTTTDISSSPALAAKANP